MAIDTTIAVGLPGGGDPTQQGVGNQDPNRKGAAVVAVDPNAQAMAIIDADPNLTPDQKQMMKDVVNAYAGGSALDNQAILDAFQKVKTTTIDPHYADLANQAIYSFKTNIADLNAQRQRDLQTEREALGSKEGGLMNSRAAEQVGSLASVVPFGGSIPQAIANQDKLINTDTQQRYLENVRGQYNTAEQALGTQGIAGITGLPNTPAYTPIGGVTGSLNTERTQEYGSTLDKLQANQQAKNQLNTNSPAPTLP